MAGISSPGVGSNLDINGILSQLMAVERQPLAKLDSKEASYQAKLSAYGSIKSALSTFQSAMKGLDDVARFSRISAVSSDSAVFSGSASSEAVPGSYSVEVKQLAQGQKLASNAYANVTDVIGTGTLTLQFGTYDSTSNSFTLSNSKAAQTISIDTAHNSLGGIRDAINAANVGVSATIVNDGTGNRLAFSVKDSGAANSLKITVSDGSDASNTDATGLSALAYDPTGVSGSGKNLTQTVAAQDAILKVDGIDNIKKPNNTVTDVIQGVTLNLLKASALNTPATLTVSRDTGVAKKAVEEFVKAFNDINKTVRDLTAYNAASKRGAILQGDSAANGVIAQIRSVFSQTLTGMTGAFTQLGQIGVSFQKDGTLAVDGTKLGKALESNPDAISGLFATTGRASDSLIKYVSASEKTLPGSYALEVTQVATQASLAGNYSSALADSNADGTFDAPVLIDSSNNAFSIKVDGVLSGTISLNTGSYASVNALTAEIQSKINGDSALKAAGDVVTVGFDNTSGNEHLTFSSNRYGAASKVAFSSVNALLGLDNALPESLGVDVAGTINGASATGYGQTLTGVAGGAEGLQVQVLGGGLGGRGSASFSQGFADRLEKLAAKLTENKGFLDSRTEGINRSIKDIGTQREALQRRLVDTEQRYRAQFTALDVMLGQMRRTSDYLTQQLANLPKIGQ